MPLILDVILALGLASAFAGAVRVWRRTLSNGRREDLRALAARRGWSLTVTEERLGRAGTLRLSSRGGHAWSVEIRTEGGGGAIVTDYEADSPSWPGGTLVAVQGPVAADARSIQKALGPEIARLAQPLERVPLQDGLLAFSDADPSLRLIPRDLARAMDGWTGPGRPVMVLSPAGLRLRLRMPVERADRMERLVDLAFGISRVIGP